MASRWYSIVIDSADHPGLARWWASVLGWTVAHEDDDETTISGADGEEPVLTFVPVPEGKAGKNRLHVDLAPDDQAAEVARLVDLGAKPVDVGQQDVSWVVLADPEGNEFCVLTAR